MKKDPRIDAYIAKSADFAKPILKHIRAQVHAACPAVEETIKWGFPNFEYKGPLCGMASFKQHCALGFWKASLISKATGMDVSDEAMGQFGKILSLKDLPGDRDLKKMIKEAVRLNDEGIKVARTPKAPRKPLPVPADLKAALRKNKAAKTTFEAFSPSNRRDYVEWITEAKTDETREKRLATAVEWMAEGKIRNWKYARRK